LSLHDLKSQGKVREFNYRRLWEPCLHFLPKYLRNWSRYWKLVKTVWSTAVLCGFG